MLKSEAIERWGEEVVEEARDYYETDFDKYLFDEDAPQGEGYGAREEDQIERCTRASRNLKLDGPIDQTMGRDERYGLERTERYQTRRSVTHEYVYGMPVAAYREKRTDLTPEELEFLRGDPGYQYSEHWSTPNLHRAQRLFNEYDVGDLLEDITNRIIYLRDQEIDDSFSTEEALNIAIDYILKLRS